MFPVLSLVLSLALQAPAVHFSNTLSYVQSLQHGAEFAPLDAATLAALQEAATALWAGDGPGAQQLAAATGYQVNSLQTDDEWLWLLVPGEATPAGQAVLVVREVPERDLLIEAPHVPFDSYTDEEAAMLFDRVHARGLLIAGAARCATSEPAACGASGVACKLAQAPESDVAHAVRNAFFALHSGITDRHVDTLVLQLHANGAAADNGDVLLSNGSRSLAGEGALVNRLAAAMRSASADIRSCNSANTPPSAAALCGSGNVQGHALHGAANACSPQGPAANERFVHLEQNSGALRNNLQECVERLGRAIVQIL